MNENLIEMIENGIDAVHDMDVTHHDYAVSIAKTLATRLHECVNPLEWVQFGTMAYVSSAPLFGRIRVEQFGRDDTWTVCFSVPGYCDTLVYGEWPTPETAKAAAQAHYAAQIIGGLDL